MKGIWRGKEIKPRVFPPPQELMDVHLIPISILMRLNEYHSDEKIAYSLVGLLGGSMLSILTTWATSSPLIITNQSVILLFVFSIMEIFCIAWIVRINGRVRDLMKDLSNRSQIS